MKNLKRSRGTATTTVLFVMFVLLTSVIVVGQLASASILKARRESVAAQTFQYAQAGVDYIYQKQMEELESTFGYFQNTVYSYDDLPITLPNNAEGTVTIEPISDGSYAWITSEVTVSNTSRSVRVLVSSRDVNIWNNAIFAGTGASGKAINGNVDIRGSVHLLGDGEPYTDLNGNGKWDGAEPFTDSNGNGKWDPGEPFTDLNGDGVWNPAEPYNDSNGNGKYDPPLTVTELNSSFSGNAFIGNHYDGMPSNLLSKIPPIPTYNGLQTLSTEVRVKHGLIRLQGAAKIGTSTNFNGQKAKIDGAYVNDGWAGNPGESAVFSDNGTKEKYDLGDRVKFPYITGIGAEEYTYPGNGQTYSTFKDFLNDQSMTVTIGKIAESTPAFQFGPDANGNMLKWTPKSGSFPGKLEINGIVKVNGNLTLGDKKQTIYYDGKGTLYATGDIDVHANLFPANNKIFPTQAVLGLLAEKNMYLATGSGDSQLSMMGAFYAQGTIVSAKQNQIAGTFVANFYDMGTNVPNIYQVPELRKNLPPGMPGDESIISLKRRTWRERVPN